MRWRAAEAFGKIGAEAVEPRMEPLIEALTDERLFVRASAAQALGIIGSAKLNMDAPEFHSGVAWLGLLSANPA